MSNRFHFRSFVAFGLFFAIVWLLVSGTVLYVSPPGRIAHWQHWLLLGLSKEQWQAQHTLFSYFFILLTIWHIFFLNWRNLWSYVKLKSSSQMRKKKEFAFAVLVFLGVLMGTHLQLPPFSSFYDLGETIGFSWEEKQKAAPIPHMENLSLDEVAQKYLKQEAEELIETLRVVGIQVEGKEQLLKDVAQKNGKSPAQLYAILVPAQGHVGQPRQGGSGKGYGRMTIEEVAADMGLEPETVISTLKAHQIQASPSQSLKEIASEYHMHPSELVKLIEEGK
ncbi:MAG: DUF4405 domain-containing protein [Cyclobacteriaceae bacterium]|nr:DUF4405 domain-containing protein [Cyclobacteriaceae bacterium]